MSNSPQALKEKLAHLAQKRADEALALRDQLAPYYTDKAIQAYIHLLTEIALTYKKAASVLDDQQ